MGRQPLYPSTKGKPNWPTPEIERSFGQVVRVKRTPVKTVGLPDWSLEYVEFPSGEMEEYRDILIKAVRIVKVTKSRIYYEERG